MIKKREGFKTTLGITSSKGGVGKSQTTIELGEYFRYIGYKVVVFDLDHQQINSAQYFAGYPELKDPSRVKLKDIIEYILENYIELKKYPMGDAYNTLADMFLDSLVFKEDSNNSGFMCVRSNMDIAEVEQKLLVNGEVVNDIFKILSEIALRHFDIVLYDCPPDITKSMVRSVYASVRNILIPSETDDFSKDAVQKALMLKERVRVNGSNPNINVVGIFLNKADKSTTRYSIHLQDYIQLFGDLMLDIHLPKYESYALARETKSLDTMFEKAVEAEFQKGQLSAEKKQALILKQLCDLVHSKLEGVEI